MLEVSQLNEQAIGFYERTGYSVLSSFEAGEAGGGAEHIVRAGMGGWEVRQTGKHVMQKALV